MKQLIAILAGMTLAAGCGSSTTSSTHVSHTPVACNIAIGDLNSESIHLLKAIESMDQKSSVANQIVAIGEVEKATGFAKLANPLITKCEAH